MPAINKPFVLEVTPEQFLNNCSPEELYETMLLLASPRYQDQLATVMFQKEELVIHPNQLVDHEV